MGIGIVLGALFFVIGILGWILWVFLTFKEGEYWKILIVLLLLSPYFFVYLTN